MEFQTGVSASTILREQHVFQSSDTIFFVFVVIPHVVMFLCDMCVLTFHISLFLCTLAKWKQFTYVFLQTNTGVQLVGEREELFQQGMFMVFVFLCIPCAPK